MDIWITWGYTVYLYYIYRYIYISSIIYQSPTLPCQADRCFWTGLRCDPPRRLGRLLGSCGVWWRQPDGPTSLGGCAARMTRALGMGQKRPAMKAPWRRHEETGNQAVVEKISEESHISYIFIYHSWWWNSNASSSCSPSTWREIGLKHCRNIT